MNIDNGHLIRLAVVDGGQRSNMCTALSEMAAISRQCTEYMQVPPELQGEAERELAGENETYVNLEKSSPLAAWASKKREERDKKKSKRKAAKASRKKNRG